MEDINFGKKFFNGQLYDLDKMTIDELKSLLGKIEQDEEKANIELKKILEEE